MNITPYKDINEILGILNQDIPEILGKNLVGLYLTGSLTYGDFDRGSSDIDFIAIVKKNLSEEQFQKIANMHSKIGEKYPEWRKRIEGQYTPYVWFKKFIRPNGKRIYVNGGKVNLHQYGDEWLINYFVLYEKGVAIFGHDPKDILRKVDIEEVRKASRKDLVEYWSPKINKDNAFVEKGYETNHIKAYTILTLCRILHRAKSDEVASKRKASAWVKKTYPQWVDLVEIAEHWKHGEKIEDEEKIKKFIKFVVEETK